MLKSWLFQPCHWPPWTVSTLIFKRYVAQELGRSSNFLLHLNSHEPLSFRFQIRQGHKSMEATNPTANLQRRGSSTCSQCGRSFARKAALDQHLPSHTKERRYSCSKCYTKFLRKGDRDRHEKRQHASQQFRCGGPSTSGHEWGCGRTFARSDALNEHFKSKRGQTCLKSQKTESAETSPSIEVPTKRDEMPTPTAPSNLHLSTRSEEPVISQESQISPSLNANLVFPSEAQAQNTELFDATVTRLYTLYGGRQFYGPLPWNIKAIMCLACWIQFSDVESLRAHFEIHLRDGYLSPYRCTNCWLYFQTFHTFACHWKQAGRQCGGVVTLICFKNGSFHKRGIRWGCGNEISGHIHASGCSSPCRAQLFEIDQEILDAAQEYIDFLVHRGVEPRELLGGTSICAQCGAHFNRYKNLHRHMGNSHPTHALPSADWEGAQNWV